MAKQLNVNLSFTADASKARQQLQDLQQSLDKLISSTHGKTTELGLTQELAQATSEASKLKIMLESAMTPTGTLDLGKFSQGLRKSGLELKDYANTLQSLGPEGAKTFAKLAQSITTANVPLKQTNRLLDEFATTMKNTVRWQFSSSMLHGFMGAMSGALGYAKDLDESLNNIRIVTGYNVDQMAQFATEANKAAKALSSTTTDYTNASLIYYQQGLGEEEIAKRTEVTLKMANAAGVSAQTVSDQMTAVWNNFYDGSKSLEYYADVMTALGAATASSTDEISAGLNKFAAVAETVGLSYEYATAALATVTATTRESADVVGTAFKTLFARIQGLNLGETLDDGTTLNKYSSALAKVGIDIKDTNGNIKDMNIILDEMGAKWSTLAKDQQIALAQTVAGVRQYTQLMALMDNWDYFEENVKVAEQSTGTLQEQAEIYAESWEASSKRVRAAAEGIYDKLLDEQFFIGVNKILEGTLSHVGDLIDGLGGLPGVLSVVSSLMLKAFGKDIVDSMERMAYNIKLSSKAGREEILQLRKDANKQMASMNDDGTISGSTSVDVYKQESKLQEEILQKTFELEARNKTLTEEEQKQVGLLVDKNRELGQQVIHLAQAREQQEATAKSLQSQLLQKTQYTDKTKIAGLNEELAKIKEQQVVYSTFQPLFEKLRESAAKIVVGGKSNNLTQYRTEVKALEKSLKEMGLTIDDITSGNTDIISAETVQRIKDFFNIAKTGSKEEIQKALQDIQDDLAAVGADAELNFQKLKTSLNELDGVDKAGINKLLSEIQSSFMQTGRLSEEQIQKFKNLGVQIDESGRIIQGFNGKVYTTADSMVALANVITGLSSALNMIKGLGDIWSDEDTTYGEKVIATLSSIAMILPTLINAYKTWNSVKLTGVKNDLLALATQKLKNNTDQKGLAIKFSENALQKIKNKELSTEIVLKTILNALDLKKIAIYAALALAIGAVIAVGKILYDNYNKEAIAAKRLADSYKELNEASQEARAEADKLNSTISGYDDAVEKLEACTRGTEEWRDALKEVNEAAIEVIENLPDALPDNMKLTDLYSRDSNGMIVFDRDKLDQVQNSVNLDAESAAYAASAGDVRAQQAQITSDSVDLFRDMVRTQNNMAVAAASSGTTSPVNYVDGRSLVDNLEELSNLPFEEFKNKLEDLGVETAYLTDTALADYQDQINKLAESSEFAAEKLDLITRVKVDDVLGDDYDSETKDIAARDLSSEEERLRNEYLEKYTGWGINQASGSNNDIYQAILKDLQDAGYNYDAQKSNAVRGNDKNRSFAFLDKNGDEVIRTAEWVAETVAASKALQNLEASAEEASTWLGNLDKNASDSTASGVRSVISGGDLSGLTQNEITQLSNDMGGADGNLTSDEIINYLKTTMGITDDADLAKVFGVDDVGEVAANWLDIISSTNEQFAKIVADLPTAVRGIFEGMDLEKFSLNEQGIIGNLLVDAFENGGTKGAKELESILNSMFTASGEDADDLAKALGGINWQTTDISELTQILEDAGVETSGFVDELAKLIGLMQEGQNVGFEAASEHYNTMKDMADLKEGDTITEEQYKYLVNAGIDVSEYFKLMSDGSYALKEDAEEFYRIVNEKSLDVFKSNIKAMYEEIGSVDGIMRRRNEDSIATNNVNTDGEYNQSLVSDQLTFLEALGVELENLEVYQKTVEEGRGMSVEALQEIQRLVEENKNRWDELPESIQASAVELEKHQQALANSASTVDELNRLYEEQFITLEQYQEAVDEVMENEFEMEGLDPDAAEEVADAFRDMAEAGVEGMEALKNDEEAVKDATVRYMELNEAIEDIYDNYKDYTQVLKDVRKATSKADRAMAANTDSAKKLKVSMAGLLGTTEDMIDADFLATIDPKDFEAAANGNADAIERIRNQFIQLKAEMYGIDFASLKSELDAFNNGAYIDLNTTPFLNALIQAAINAGQTAAEIEAMLSGFGIDADVTPFTEELWQATQQAQAAGQNIANATSFTTEVEQTPVENTTTTELPQFTEAIDIGYKTADNYVTLGNGFQLAYFQSKYAVANKTVSSNVTPMETTEEKTVSGQTVTNGAGASGKGGVIVKNAHKAPAPSKAPGAGNTSRPPVSGGGGGGSNKTKEPSKPKKIDTTKQEEIVKRYKEIDDALDDLSDEYEKASRSADRLWGENRLDAIREQNKLIEEQQELLKEKQRQAENYMNQDRAALNKAAAEAGLSFSYDDKGNITNYTDQMTNLYNQLAAAEAHYNSLATGEEQEAYEETILDPLKDKIKAVEDAIEIYEESKELFEELGLDIEDLQDQIMQNNYDIIMEGLELHISFNEEDLENIDYYLSKLEDDFYSMAEAAALMVGADGSSQLNEYLSNLEEYGKAMDDLHKAYADGEITEAAYQEGLKEIRSNIRDNLSSLLELDKAMMEYYGETLAMAQEELAKYTDRMQQQTEVLQHYGNMMEILGKQLDYNSMGVILQGQVDTIENEMNVAEAAYNMYKQQAEEKRALYEEAMENNDLAAAELYKKEWEAAQEAADEAQSEMLSKTEEWAEAMHAVVENKLAGLAKSLEEALTGGTSFDQINLQLERAVSLQEEYLTTTNQIYETNKLMRTAQQAIDKSTNSVAKQRLKDFIKETDQLQDKAKLSQYELEIQQAKYNLLLAEIALEDAQNAKSTVRLQRDSEGNFGYVYTADQTQLAQAQQELEDAQNSLYNIGLEGAGNYTEKYTQTMQEMYDTLTSITEAYYNGEITSQEDYEAQMLAAQEYYYQQLENYQDLYGIALQTDTRVIQDSWTSSFRTMINNTENWKIKVNDYSIAAGQSLANWYSKVEEISQKTGLDNIANNVKKVTDESKALRDIVLGTDGEPGVINALQQELKEVSDLTRQYATFRTTLQGVITEYEKLINAANRLAEANARAGVNNSSNNSGSSSSNNSSNYSSSNSNNASSSNNTNDLSSSGESNSSSGRTQTANKYKATYNLRGRSNTISGYYSEDAARAAAESAINSAISALTGITFSEKNDIAAAARRSIQIARYNTGGYTGSWGPYGKLGILDEKELILNPEDTENFLASMKVLERILEIIDLQAVNSQLGGTLLTPSIGNSITSQSLEQSVHIEASFPGVQDRNEIEEAFNTLINKASQYANRK